MYGTREFGQVTVIARTNLGLFEEMAKVLRLPGGDTKRLGFVGVREMREEKVDGSSERRERDRERQRERERETERERLGGSIERKERVEKERVQ